MLTWQFCLSGTHQLTHREKCTAVGFAFITKASTCHWQVVPCIAATIPCSGDAALQWGFLRTQHQKLYQVHPHALWLRKRGRSSSATISWNGYCGCGLGRMLHSSKFLDPEFFSTGTISIIPTKCSVTSLTEVTCAVKKKFTKNSKKCEIWVFFFSSSRVWRMGMRKKREKQRGLG